MHADLRTAVPEDVPAVLALWRASALPISTDTPEALAHLLRHDQGALIVAVAAGEIVGSVIGGWDGWRGSIYRLVVSPAHRRQGLGRMLLAEAENRLRSLGARRMHAIVVGTDPRATAFWHVTVWEHQHDQQRYTSG